MPAARCTPSTFEGFRLRLAVRLGFYTGPPPGARGGTLFATRLGRGLAGGLSGPPSGGQATLGFALDDPLGGLLEVGRAALAVGLAVPGPARRSCVAYDAVVGLAGDDDAIGLHR